MQILWQNLHNRTPFLLVQIDKSDIKDGNKCKYCSLNIFYYQLAVTIMLYKASANIVTKSTIEHYLFWCKILIWSPCSHETFKSNRSQLILQSCEHKQKVSNWFQTDLVQTYLRVGLKSVWHWFGDKNRHVNALANWNRFGFNCFLLIPPVIWFYIYRKWRFQNFLQN